MDSYLHIIISTSAVYFFVIIGFRIFGKTELAQLSITDLIFVLLISNSLQNAMVGSNTSLSGGIIAASVLFAVNIILKKLKFKFPIFKTFVEGEPVLLIYRGKIQIKNCSKNGISHEELLESIREHGFSSIEEIDSLILESDGNISVVAFKHIHHSIRRIKRRKTN